MSAWTTGTQAGEVRPSLGWIVGWAEKGSKQTLFALNLDIRENRHVGSRMKLTQQLLADIGVIQPVSLSGRG